MTFRTALIAALLSGTAVGAGPALADEPACDAPAAVAVHALEEAAAGTAAGPVATPVVHGVVEPAVCP